MDPWSVNMLKSTRSPARKSALSSRAPRRLVDGVVELREGGALQRIVVDLPGPETTIFGC
jgi:hypothetical protein